jgi:hypothetical protein
MGTTIKTISYYNRYKFVFYFEQINKVLKLILTINL